LGGPSQLTHNYYQMVVIVRKDTRWGDRVKTRAVSPRFKLFACGAVIQALGAEG